MAIVATDWTITRSTKVIAYTGNTHTGVNPSYATVIEFHRWLQGLADDAVATPASSDQLDVTNIDPSRRSTDNIITLINGYTIDQTSSEHLYDGSVIQGTSGSDIWDGIVNFGNKGVLIQLHQNGSVVSNDWWNYSLGGTHTGTTHATIMTDSALSTALSNRGLGADDLIGFTLYNVTDGSHGIITANTTGTITVGGGLFGGTENDFDTSDTYKVGLGVNRSVSAGISHRWMQKVRTAAADVDLRKLLGINRRFGYTYGEFSINGTSRGNNVLALSDSADLNNATSETTVSGWQDVYIDRTNSTATVSGVNSTGQAVLNVSNGALFADGDFIMWAGENSEYKITSITVNALTLNRNLQVATVGGEIVYDLNIGYKSIDVDNNAVNENYYAVWDRGAKTINQFYEYGKYQVADGSIEQVFGLNGELFRGITHEVVVGATRTGTFDVVEAVSWSGGTGQMLAIDSRATGTKMWIQLLTGVAPTNTQVITGANSGATVTATATITERSISKPFVGASTGSALIGSYGLALQTADLSSADKVTDLTNTVISPPNNVTNTVAGLASGEDRVLVAPWDGSTTDTNGDPAITKTQLAIKAASALTTDNITSVAVSTAIPSDTPGIGYIRVIDNNGFERRLHYSAWATDTFTIDTTDGNEDFASVNANVGNNVWIAYVDALYNSADTSGPGGQNGTDRFTSVQTGSRNLVVIVRDGGGTPIKQFISSWTQTSSNQTINAIRTTDL